MGELREGKPLGGYITEAASRASGIQVAFRQQSCGAVDNRGGQKVERGIQNSAPPATSAPIM